MELTEVGAYDIELLQDSRGKYSGRSCPLVTNFSLFCKVPRFFLIFFKGVLTTCLLMLFFFMCGQDGYTEVGSGCQIKLRCNEAKGEQRVGDTCVHLRATASVNAELISHTMHKPSAGWAPITASAPSKQTIQITPAGLAYTFITYEMMAFTAMACIVTTYKFMACIAM